MWSLYYSIQQKIVRYCSPFSRIVWKKTDGDRNYLKQQKSVEILLFWSQFSTSDVNIDVHWRCRGRLHERMRYIVDIKVDGYCGDYF